MLGAEKIYYNHVVHDLALFEIPKRRPETIKRCILQMRATIFRWVKFQEYSALRLDILHRTSPIWRLREVEGASICLRHSTKAPTTRLTRKASDMQPTAAIVEGCWAERFERALRPAQPFQWTRIYRNSVQGLEASNQARG